MPKFNLEKVGSTTRPYSLDLDAKRLALYALGIGAKRDELSYLYEGAKGGMKAYPTFAVVAAFEAIAELMLAVGGNLATVVHGGQTVRAHRAVPTSGKVETTATLTGIYDNGKFARVVLDTRSLLGGAPLFDTTWSIIFRGAGNFGGPPPPEAAPVPSIPTDRAPDWMEEEATLPEQALLYRLSGDVNPLHADPELAVAAGFARGPILHGLATYGFAARAITKHEAGGDATKLRYFAVEFRKPVWPGDTIVTQGYRLGEGKVAIVASVKDRPEPVLTNAWAEVG